MTTPEEKADLLRARTPGQVMALGMGAVALSFLFAGIVFEFASDAPVHVVSIVANALGMIAVPVAYVAWQRLHVAASLRLLPVPTPQLLWVLGMIVAIVPAVLALGQWNQRLVPPPPEYLERVAQAMPETLPQWILAVFAMVVVAPIAEEIVFRGMVQQAARRAIGRWFSVVFTAVVFAVWHGQLWNVAALTLVGLFLGLAFEATGSLLASIAAHSTYNFVVMLIYTHGTDVPDLPPTAAAFGAACALAVAWAAYGRLRVVVPWPEIDREGEAAED